MIHFWTCYFFKFIFSKKIHLPKVCINKFEYFLFFHHFPKNDMPGGDLTLNMLKI